MKIDKLFNGLKRIANGDYVLEGITAYIYEKQEPGKKKLFRLSGKDKKERGF